MELNTLRDLYVDELRDIYDAEHQLLKALPKLAKKASNRDLQRAFRNHERETQRQKKRLERVFKELGLAARRKPCEGMKGLIEEGEELIKEKPAPDVLDAGLIASAQKVEHYEIASYGTVRAYAQQLGLESQARLLQETLDEESNANELLTELAMSSINVEAEDGGDEGSTRSAGRRNGRSRNATRKRRAA